MGQRRVTHLWACGPPKSVDALRTGRKESEQASQTHTPPPRDQSHSPSPQRLRGGRGRPSVPEDPPVHGPRAPPVAETSWLRAHPRQSLSSGHWGAFPCSRLHSTHRPSYLLSGARSRVHLWGEEDQ